MATANDHTTLAPNINHPAPNTTAQVQVTANTTYTAAGIAVTGGGER